MARVDRTYISSIAFMEQREILNEVLDVTSEDVNILDIMDMAGRSEVTDVVEYHHFENDYLFQSGTLSETVTGGVTTDATCVCEVATEAELPVAGEQAMIDSNKVVGYVLSVDVAAKTFVLKPPTGVSWDTGGTPLIADTDVLIYFSGAYGEGSDDPAGRVPNWIRSVNNIQIFKESGTITDLQKVSKIEVNYNNKPHVMYKMQHDTLQRHRAKIAYAYLVGAKDKKVDASGYDVWETQGLRNYILNGDGAVNTTGGQDVPVTTITKANFRSMSRLLDKKGAPDEYWGWFGGDLQADFEDAFHGTDENILTGNGGIQYNSFGKGSGKKKALDFGVNSVHLYSRTYHITKIKAYDHEELFGAGSFDFASEGYLIPTGKIKCDKSGATKERILNRFMAGDGEDFGGMNETVTGKLAPNPTNTTSVLSVGYQSICGLEVLGVKHFGIFS